MREMVRFIYKKKFINIHVIVDKNRLNEYFWLLHIISIHTAKKEYIKMRHIYPGTRQPPNLVKLVSIG